MMKYNSIKEIVKGVHSDTYHQNGAHPQNRPIDCDGVQLTNAQCFMVPISISWYRESWTIPLKCTFETKQGKKQYHIIQHTIMATPTFGMYVS